MTKDKLKEYFALFGGWLSTILLLLQTLGLYFDWFNPESIDAFVAVLMASIPFIIAAYGIYKNTYVVTKVAKIQENELKEKGLK
ncbi:PTS mannose transporter subunit IID [Rummeliibacillus stabekisii]|uniref:phage holin n=1 Tax=Rummeliibacillus stabekisii TaxID=241244 RepID=UPI00203DC822|nr:phage holin [Rummeliibacillus stabekisii]MCM3316705.1 PTS mannose transporter subunit IID [Rummeliibacillus stabekisii]